MRKFLLFTLIFTVFPLKLTAEELFLDVSEGVYTPFTAHNWIRTFPDTEGWFLLHAAGGDYLLDHLDDDLEVDSPNGDSTFLTGRNDLIDHGIASCPDGSYLHVSFTHSGNSDTQVSFKYDSEWNLVASNVLVENDPQVHASDPPVLCSTLMNSTGHGYGNSVPYKIVVMDDTGALVTSRALEDGVSSTGSSILAEPDLGTILIVGFPWGQADTLEMRRYNTELELVESRSLALDVPANRRAMWPQGLMKVGDYHLVAYVVTTEVGGVESDTGDIWLSAYGPDWALEETVVVVEETEDYWAYMRPGLSRKGDQLLVSFDHHDGPFLALVTLNLEAMGAEDELTPSETPATGDDDTPDDGGGCSCTTATPLDSTPPHGDDDVSGDDDTSSTWDDDGSGDDDGSSTGDDDTASNDENALDEAAGCGCSSGRTLPKEVLVYFLPAYLVVRRARSRRKGDGR